MKIQNAKIKLKSETHNTNFTGGMSDLWHFTGGMPAYEKGKELTLKYFI